LINHLRYNIENQVREGLFMNPTAHSILNFIALGVLIIGTIVRLKYFEADKNAVIDSLFYIILGALLGAWLFKAVPRFVIHLKNASIYVRWWDAGLHWMGALSGGTLAGYLFCRAKNLSFGVGLDLFMPMIPLAQAVGRIGCIYNADSFGRETESWLGAWLPDPQAVYAYRYPTQVASILANLLIAAILFSVEVHFSRKTRKPGWYFEGYSFVLYIALYGLQRFFFQFWRGDILPLFGPFSWTHMYCVLWIFFAAGVFFFMQEKHSAQL
jgi:phosphatidylglycerol---prolipoprotein diacylglyceryl transferase